MNTIELPIDADGNSLAVGDEVACFAIVRGTNIDKPVGAIEEIAGK